jgi:cytochrome c peroxidase
MSKKTVMLSSLSLCLTAGPSFAQELTPSEQLGKSIFFDENVSVNGNQSCAACHALEAGWSGPDSALNAAGTVYEGSVEGRFGNRKPPSSAYATPSPVLHYVVDKKDTLFIGGNFWDGRATGEKLGNPAADQAQGPFLNPVEQALSSPADVVSKVCSSSYADLFKQVWGANACDPDEVERAYDYIARSVADFEASPESNAFTSKYDYYLKGKAKLTKKEKKGLRLFKGKAKCANCHPANPGPGGQPPLFTDFTYDNIGMPRNPANPFYTQTEFNPDGLDWTDGGLGEFLASRPDYRKFASENLGKHKVPTLRNVDKRPYTGFVKAYGHNGYFKSLKGIVHFYNTRDIKPTCADPLTTEADARAQNCWPAPEVPATVNTEELGNLHLTEDQEDAIVAFLRTLSDGYQP